MVSKQHQDERSADAAPNPQFCTPWGRELVISAINGTALYCINYRDGKGGALPEQYSGRYTKPEYAAEDAKLLLKELWFAYQEAQAQVQLDHAVIDEMNQKENVEPKRRGRPPKTLVSVE